MTWIADALRSRIAGFRSRYTAMLEEEVERLRGENRALLNSLLGTAGFPPVDFPEAKPATAGKPVGQAMSRVRRRSWQQIAALREIEEARKGNGERVER